jgi:hypothetical protein
MSYMGYIKVSVETAELRCFGWETKQGKKKKKKTSQKTNKSTKVNTSRNTHVSVAARNALSCPVCSSWSRSSSRFR